LQSTRVLTVKTKHAEFRGKNPTKLGQELAQLVNSFPKLPARGPDSANKGHKATQPILRPVKGTTQDKLSERENGAEHPEKNSIIMAADQGVGIFS
jgi:hypothetical protein